MKRRLQSGILCILSVLLLGGCSDVLLEESPRDFGLQYEDGQAASGPVSDGAGASEKGAAPEAEAGAADGSRCCFLEDGSGFALADLNDAERVWYHDMEQILGGYQTEVKLSGEGLAAGLDEVDLDRIFQCVMNDHPELFYVEGYSYTKYTRFGRSEDILAIEFSGRYTSDLETVKRRYDRIQTEVRKILDGIDGSASEYDKVKYVYDTLIRATDYQLDAPDNQNIYSVFVNHRSVCQGYAKATQYLLNRLGVECALILGTVPNGEGHAWNLVNVDGSYYYVDTTWGDASYQPDGDSDVPEGTAIPEVNYDYLNVTTEELLRTHTLDDRMTVPVCVDTAANYYVREGALFTDYERDRMSALFARALEQGRSDITVKCANRDCYDKVVSALITDQEIFNYFDGGGGTVGYTQNPVQMSLTFWVTND